MEDNYNINFSLDERYTVVGVDGGKGYKNRMYKVLCKVCNSDQELFPKPFRVSRPSLKKGGLCCGCNRNYRYGSEQLKVLLKRKAETLGMTVQALGDPVRKESPVVFYCCDKSEGKETTVGNFLAKQSRHCPHEGKHWRTDQTKARLEQVYEGRYTNFNFNKDTSLWEFNCNNCSSDEFVKAGLCDGIFSASASRLAKTEVTTCRCGHYSILTPNQNLYRCVQNSEEGYEVTGYEESYKGTDTLIGFVCPKGNKNIATVSSYLSGRRCTCCKGGGGFNRNKQGTFYLVKWKHLSGVSFIKYGITNRTVEERIRQQFNTASKELTYEVLRTFTGTGEEVFEIEREIRSLVKGGYVSPFIFPDGWTETCSVAKEEELISVLERKV